MSIIKRLFVKVNWCWLFVCLITACTPESLTPTAPATIPALVTASITPVSTQQFTPTSLSTSTSPAPATATTAGAPDLVVENIIPTANPAPASQTPIPPTPEPILTPIPIPVGVIYSTQEGLWRVRADGSTTFLLDQRYGEFSLDGSQFLYDEGNDIWLANFNDGTVRNITNTPDRNECCARWWLGQPDKIAFGSWPLDYIPFQNAFGIKDLGFLTVVNWDGTGYQVLDEATSIFSWLAPSPRYPVIIYHQSVYSTTEGIQALNSYSFAFVTPPGTPIIFWQSPVWSPDGGQIVFYASRNVEFQSHSQEGFLLINWDEQNAQYFSDYTVLGTDTVTELPAWSLDGRFLAIEVRNNNLTDRGLWIFDTNDLEAVFTPSQNMRLLHPDVLVWHQTTNTLICSTYEGSRTGYKHWLIDPMLGVIGQLDLPNDAIPIRWD